MVLDMPPAEASSKSFAKATSRRTSSLACTSISSYGCTGAAFRMHCSVPTATSQTCCEMQARLQVELQASHAADSVTSEPSVTDRLQAALVRVCCLLCAGRTRHKVQLI